MGAIAVLSYEMAKERYFHQAQIAFLQRLCGEITEDELKHRLLIAFLNIKRITNDYTFDRFKLVLASRIRRSPAVLEGRVHFNGF